MSDNQPLTDEQAAALAAEAEAQAAASPSAAADQAATAAAMAGAERGPQLPAETEIDDFMAQMRAQFADMTAQINALKAQQLAALAAQGTPHVVRYAEGARDKIAALVAQHPDAPRGHFDAVAAAAGQLYDEAGKLAAGNGAISALEKAGAAVVKFAERGHGKAWPKHIDWSAIASDVEDAIEAAAKLVPAAAAVL